MKKALAILIAALLLMTVPVIVAMLQHPIGSGAAMGNSAALPWASPAQQGGPARVLGVALGDPLEQLETLRDQARQGLEWGLLLRDGHWTVEAYANPWQAGYVEGRAIFEAPVPTAQGEAWATRGVSQGPSATGGRRFDLRGADLAEARQLALRSVTFIPTARLDEVVLGERFGPATEVIGGAEGLRNFVYPARGLVVSLEPGGRAVLRYLRPDAFAGERAGLVAAAAAEAASTASAAARSVNRR